MVMAWREAEGSVKRRQSERGGRGSWYSSTKTKEEQMGKWIICAAKISSSNWIECGWWRTNHSKSMGCNAIHIIQRICVAKMSKATNVSQRKAGRSVSSTNVLNRFEFDGTQWICWHIGAASIYRLRMQPNIPRQMAMFFRWLAHVFFGMLWPHHLSSACSGMIVWVYESMGRWKCGVHLATTSISLYRLRMCVALLKHPMFLLAFFSPLDLRRRFPLSLYWSITSPISSVFRRTKEKRST